jgi:hypothetical protein
MSLPQSPKPAKLIVGLFMRDKDLIDSLANELVKLFGPVDLISAWFPFDFTPYYHNEMGSPLFRRMLAFKNLIEQSNLAGIKIRTNAIEQKYARHETRSVNIDPGYMLLERFVLATGKNYSHRIYIGKGIYADLTLIFESGAFRKLPWTYPDYSDKVMLEYLQQVRNKYALDLKTGKTK